MSNQNEQQKTFSQGQGESSETGRGTTARNKPSEESQSRGGGQESSSVQDVTQRFIGKEQSIAKQYLTVIEEMLNESNGAYDYADMTLEGIHECILECGKISERQIEAIKNIRNKPSAYDPR